MPQPIRVKCHAEISGFTHRPQHAAVMGEIIGISGRLESALGWLLAFMSRGSATITIAMFHAIVSTDAQRSMLLAAANHALAGPERDAFHELMEDFRPRYGERSRLVHNLWGHSTDHPDKALWWRSSDVGISMARLASAPTVAAMAEAAKQEDMCFKAMAYTVADMRAVATRLQEYTGRVNSFLSEIWHAHPALAAATISSTETPPIGDQPRLDLPENPQTET